MATRRHLFGKTGESGRTGAGGTRGGRPDFDLRDWADRCDCSFRGSSAQAGYLSITCPWDEDILFNVVRGRWPGGTYGILCHEARYVDATESDRFAVARIEGANTTLLTSGVTSAGQFRVAYTNAGTRVPHLASVTGLHVVRKHERHWTDAGLDIWQDRSLDDLGLPDWVAGVRKHSDASSIEAILVGPVRELLSSPQAPGFEIRLEYGQLVVSRQDFVHRNEDLDALVANVESLSRVVTDLCTPRPPVSDLGEIVAPPPWLPGVVAHPDDTHTLMPVGARLERVAQIATERDLTLEDARSFHGTFPTLNAPGEAFGVFRGKLPGTTTEGRLLCCVERPMRIPEEVERLLRNPGGPVGCDVAVIAVDTGATPTPPEGEPVDGLRFAIGDGRLTVWRLRQRWQADGPSLDRLAGDAVAIAKQRDLVP